MIASLKKGSVTREFFLNTMSTFRQSYSFARANLQMRYERNYLGILWFLLEPLLYFIIFLSIRKHLNITIPNYSLYLLIGIIVFNFFTHMTTQSITCVSRNKEILKNMRLPAQTLVIAVILQTLYFHIFEMAILVIFLLYYNVLNLGILVYYPFILILLTLFSAGFSFFLASVGAYVLDLVSVWRLVTWVLWFTTPIFYFVNSGLIKYGPLALFTEVTRSIILDFSVTALSSIVMLILWSFGSFAIGIITFHKLKKRFAELH